MRIIAFEAAKLHFFYILKKTKKMSMKMLIFFEREIQNGRLFTH